MMNSALKMMIFAFKMLNFFKLNGFDDIKLEPLLPVRAEAACFAYIHAGA